MNILQFLVFFTLLIGCSVAVPTSESGGISGVKKWTSLFDGASNVIKKIFSGNEVNLSQSTKSSTVELSPSQILDTLDTMKSKILKGDLKDSLSGLLSILESDPGNFEGNRLAGAVLLALNQPKMAEKFLFNALTISNWTDLHSVANLAESFRLSDDPSLAEKIALRGLSHAQTGDQDSTGVLGYTLGAIYADLRNYTMSSDWYLASAFSQQNNIEAWVRASTLKFPLEYQDIKYAKNVLMQALELNPQNPELLFHLGIASYMDNRIEDAIALYRSALELDVSSSIKNLKASLATALHSAGRLQEAYEFYQQSAQSDPTNVILLSNYATLLCSQGYLPRGIEILKSAAKLNPQSKDVRRAMLACQVNVNNN